MGEIVNLRAARKAKVRRSAEQEAAANRIAFGRSKSERQEAELEQAIEKRRMDAHLRESLIIDVSADRKDD